MGTIKDYYGITLIVQDIITVLPGAIWPAWWCLVEAAVAASHLANLSLV